MSISQARGNVINMCKRYTLETLKTKNILKGISISDLREHTKIAIIDDQDVPAARVLKQHKFNIEHKTDILSISDVYVYDIILCDIKGVGTTFSEEKQGAHLISEIRKYYPNKYLIAYSANVMDISLNDDLRNADSVINKGISSDDWVSLLDTAIQNVANPMFFWSKVRMILVNENLSLRYIARLEEKYVKSIVEKSFVSFEKMVDNAYFRDYREMLLGVSGGIVKWVIQKNI